MDDDVAGSLVRQCKSWTTKLGGVDEVESSRPPSNSLSVSSATSSATCRPPPSPRSSLTNSARPGDPRSGSLVKSDSLVDAPSAMFFFTNTSTEDVVVAAGRPGSGTAGSDSSSGRGSASPDTRPSTRGKFRFKKILPLRPLRRTRSAGNNEDLRKMSTAGGRQQVT